MIEIHLGHHQFVLVLGADGKHVPAGIDEVRRAVEAADVPGRLGADAVAAGHEIAVRDRVRRLFEFPEILRKAGDRGRRVEDDLRAVQAKQPGAFWEMTVVADVDADGGELRPEHRVAKVARLEEVLLPKAGGMRNVVLPVLAEVRAVGVVYGGGVVVDARPVRARRPAQPSPSGISSRTVPSARSSGRAPLRRCRTNARPGTDRSTVR